MQLTQSKSTVSFFRLTTEVSGPVADLGGLERHRGWQLEDWGVERQELSGGDNHSFHPITPIRREFLTGTRLERTRHGLRLHRLVRPLFISQNRNDPVFHHHFHS